MTDQPLSPSDKTRWGASASYNPQWIERARLAAAFITEGSIVLEIGAGTGQFRDLIAEKCNYVGCDLAPLEEGILKVDLEHDELPTSDNDFTVVLGVIEYIQNLDAAFDKICNSCHNLIITYCFAKEAIAQSEIHEIRKSRRWINNMTQQEFIARIQSRGLILSQERIYEEHADFVQKIMLFTTEK